MTKKFTIAPYSGIIAKENAPKKEHFDMFYSAKVLITWILFNNRILLNFI